MNYAISITAKHYFKKHRGNQSPCTRSKNMKVIKHDSPTHSRKASDVDLNRRDFIQLLKVQEGRSVVGVKG